MQNEQQFLLAIVVIAFVAVGLVVVPPMVEQVDAKCTDGFKNNGDPCKDKKPKKN